MSASAPSGRVIDSRFTLIERLGSGGMGMVWRARDLALHRDVALKEVRPPDPALAEYDPEAAGTLRARVLREARALARLDHPNVVTIHHIVDPGEDGYPWIVMELVEGSSLQERLAAGPMEPSEAAELGRGILLALRAAHAAGIHHRDVKPANVLLRPDGRPVLTDFGIAAIRESTSLTLTGALIGSPDYIAPERIRGTEGDPSSDLWSLGMLLYVAVEGHHPLRRATTLATLAAVLDEEVPRPVRAGKLTPVLDALLTRDITARPDVAELDRMLAAATGAQAPAPAGPAPTPVGGPATLRLSRPSGAPADEVPPLAPRPPAGPSPRAVREPVAGPRSATVPGHEHDRQNRLRRRIRTIAVTSSLFGTTLTAGVLLWTYGPLSSGDGDHEPTTGASAPSLERGTTGQPDATPSEVSRVRTVDLLTPDGAREVIKSLKSVTGGTRVTDFTLYDEHASAEAPLKTDAKLYNRFTYREGRVADQAAGGTLTSSDALVDLTKVDWDKLPSLLTAAETTLNIPDPESRYVIVDPASPFHDDRPVLRVYVSDAYGGAYLTADLDGKILEKSPRESG
ncbi:serine/threonine protein kinase [Streptomyces sp. NBC_01102]|uniref:serine/threonine-protein kinase n=1 Tax=Streptomyces sp. NBC_01102 TaxID=2903749 RepID=UPI0038688462|nr:serine/threonine protein kinase [Streptomyces sp. NBC_01102]